MRAAISAVVCVQLTVRLKPARLIRKRWSRHCTIVGDPGTKPVGICGSGIIDVICELYLSGIINPKGKFVREGKRIKHDKYGMGSYVLAFEEEAGSIKDVEITEVDIDNFIRAKGAIFSAIRTMLTALDFDISMIDDVYVAGGIGSGINMQNAVNIGMFPDIPHREIPLYR